MKWTHKVINNHRKYWWYARLSGTTLYTSCVHNREGVEVCGSCHYDTFAESIEELYKDNYSCTASPLNNFKGNKL